jgi:8-amino-7-oxononanoate synthase
VSIHRHSEAQRTVDRVRHTLDGLQSSQRAERPAIATGSMSLASPVSFAELPEYEILKIKRAVGDIAGIANPFHRLHDGRAAEVTSIDGRTVVNFSSYDYLGLNGHPEVTDAAKQAIDRYGTSVSASRLSAGERQVHRDLEAALAKLHASEDALAFVSGHATNVSVIGTLLGPQDLIVCDALVHNSILEGARLSGAKRIVCAHGDVEAMERALRLNRARHRRALVIVEALYSMDGDMPDLGALVKIKRRYGAWLMVDEAHSIGVLGASGRGLAEEQDVDPSTVDIWMGTLSKTLAAAGGYIAGSRPLIELLKYNTPGFVFSVGLPPPIAAAATAALALMQREPERIAALRRNGTGFVAGAKARGLDVGLSAGAAIVPVIVGNSPQAVILAQRLLERGYNLVPAIFPGVAENQARLRFFLTSQHSQEQIDGVLDATDEELERIRREPSFIKAVAGV